MLRGGACFPFSFSPQRFTVNIKKIQRVLAPLLQPLAYPYAFIARRRRQFYTQGVKKSIKPRSITISVGNIAAGGTGKTPLTSWLLEWACSFEYQAVVLTRGYGGKTGGCPVIVSAGTNPAQCGDEPLLLARKHPEATIIAFPKRRASIQLAERFLTPDLVVLDDGMQHLAIQRDIDFVVLKENDLKEGWNKVIPAGEWREDVSALEVADAFFIKANPRKFTELRPTLLDRLGAFKKPIFSFEMVVSGLARVRGFSADGQGGALSTGFPQGDKGLVKDEKGKSSKSAKSVEDGSYIPVSAVHNLGDYILVSGVGEPKQVIETVTALLGKGPTQSFCYPDHHGFSTNDIAHIESYNLPVVCTEKDAVKLEQFILSVPYYALDVSVRFGERCLTEMNFEEWVQSTYSDLRQKQTEMKTTR